MSHHHAPKVRHDDPEMAGERARTEHGTLRRKRGDTHARTIEDQYGIDLGVRSDKQLSTILHDERVDSLSALIEKKQGQ